MDVMKKVPVREQAPDVRNKNFEEVCLGYNMQKRHRKKQHVALIVRMLQCVQGCPVSINIPGIHT